MVFVNRHHHSDVRLRGQIEKVDIRKNAHALNKQLKQDKNSLLAIWAESFIFAGSSALLLLIANLHPHYWYFSFFALTPFLYRIIKATPAESLRLGILLGIYYFGVSVMNFLPGSPSSSVFKLLLGTGLFAVFGWTLGWARKHWGFYPSIVAVLWIGLELGVIKLGFTGGLLVPVDYSNPFLNGLVGLFGFLIASAIIVLLNSLLILTIVKTLEFTRPRSKKTQEAIRNWDIIFTLNLFPEKIYLEPDGRAPPMLFVEMH